MRYLLVGLGNIGSRRKRVLGARCVAAVDPVNPEADAKSPDAVSPDRYDAAILSVPNRPKLGLLDAFLSQGKHVLVDKPLLFPDAATARRFEDLGKRKGAIWYTSYNHRFEPLILRLKEQLPAIGTLYSARLYYGNGTVRNVVGSWRDGGLGVFEDLGCHLLDLAGWLLGARGARVAVRELRPIESKGIDRCILATEDQKIVLEASFVSWKNTFTIDVTGERGSLHLNGLCKWGPSELIRRERVYPSGAPKETRETAEGSDVTWERDIAHFEECVARRESSFANDAWISDVIAPYAKPEPMRETTAFVGMSHLGLVSGAAWATMGRPVVLFDPDPAAIDRLKAGKLPVHEPGLPEAIATHAPRFTADQAELTKCPLVFVARDVPTDEDNVSSLKPIEELIERVLPHLARGAVLVHLCQVPPGFTRKLAARVRRDRPDVTVVYLVETLIFGRAMERATRPERFMVGCDGPIPPVLDRPLREYAVPVLPMRYESAELCKTAINLYLCGGVTYANTLSSLCERIGADWSEIVPALRLDRRIGPAAYIQPSLGIAGGNLERDLVTVRDACRATGADARLIEAMIDYNEVRHRWAVAMAEKHFLAKKNPSIAVWGLAYKKDTASTKNSRSLRVIRELASRATILAYDPLVSEAEGATVCGREEALRGADGLMIMTDWDEFATAPIPEGLTVIDCVGVRRDGRCVSMGRG